jgi:thiamine-phosphate pyrophosphorylase
MYHGGLCFISDHKACHLSYEKMVMRALEAGVKWVQYRDKERSRRKIYEESLKLRSITKNFGALFIINDHPDIALAVKADGVHLGQDDLPLLEARKIMGKEKIIGISTHSAEQAINAGKDGADYIGFGPVFRTLTKDAGSPKGIEMLRKIKNLVRIPVVAIGGINLDNIRSVIEAGTDAVAVASAILTGDIENNIKRFLDSIKSYNNSYRLQDAG